jgi:hypothetical protein
MININCGSKDWEVQDQWVIHVRTFLLLHNITEGITWREEREEGESEGDRERESERERAEFAFITNPLPG